MLKYILRRLLQAIPVLFAVITITFFLIRVAPGGPFDAEKNIPPEVLKNIEARYDLDKPMWHQYFKYVGSVLQGDFGPSFRYPNRNVNEMIATGFPVTCELGFYAILYALFIGTIAGLIAGIKPNTLQDYIPMTLSMSGIVMPSFLMGPILLLIFALTFEWFPVIGWEDLDSKVLPTITLGSGVAAYIARLSRGGMLNIMSQDYIRTARAKGVKEKFVVLKHALKGALLPVIAYLGPAFAALLTGSFVVETIFQIDGMGRFYVQAAFNRDYTMILGTSIFFCTMVLFFNMVADIIQVLLNPRLSFDSAAGGAR